MMGMEVREIDLARISPNLRFVFDMEIIEALSRSIKMQGQIEPIQVWFAGDSFRILDGEKRWRACKQIGQYRIKARILPAEGDW